MIRINSLPVEVIQTIVERLDFLSSCAFSEAVDNPDLEKPSAGANLAAAVRSFDLADEDVVRWISRVGNVRRLPLVSLVSRCKILRTRTYADAIDYIAGDGRASETLGLHSRFSMVESLREVDARAAGLCKISYIRGLLRNRAPWVVTRAFSRKPYPLEITKPPARELLLYYVSHPGPCSMSGIRSLKLTPQRWNEPGLALPLYVAAVRGKSARMLAEISRFVIRPPESILWSALAASGPPSALEWAATQFGVDLNAVKRWFFSPDPYVFLWMHRKGLMTQIDPEAKCVLVVRLWEHHERLLDQYGIVQTLVDSFTNGERSNIVLAKWITSIVGACGVVIRAVRAHGDFIRFMERRAFPESVVNLFKCLVGEEVDSISDAMSVFAAFGGG